LNKYNRQIIDKMDKIRETLDAIRSDLEEIKERCAHRPALKKNAGQARKEDAVINAYKGTAWEKYPEQYKKLMGIVGSLSFDAWFGPVRNIEIKDETLYITVDDEFMKTALEARYGNEIKRVFDVEKVSISSLESRG